MPGLDVVGSSSHSICLPWNYCDFEVFDCQGNVVYRGEMRDVHSNRNLESFQLGLHTFSGQMWIPCFDPSNTIDEIGGGALLQQRLVT